VRVRVLVGVGAVAIVAICVSSFAGWSARPAVVAQASATPINLIAADPSALIDGSTPMPTLSDTPAATPVALQSEPPGDAPSTGPAATPGTATPTPAQVNNVAVAAAPLGTLVSNAEPLPVCSFGGTVTPLAGQNDWALTLVDTKYQLPSGYQPDGLVEARAAGFHSGEQVRSIMIPDLARMYTATRAAKVPLAVLSGYRSYHTQVYTFGHWQNLEGFQLALTASARPGHSEHQLGLAIDFQAGGGDDPWTYKDWAQQTPTGLWLAANAWKYGFIMSYPKGKAALTCYTYEPWHYRYVGVTEAAAVHASGLTLRQWLWMHQPNPEAPSP
jgi:D-alanyl-D-alanine carboxypeptidase